MIKNDGWAVTPFWAMERIIAWKVTRELHIPKNITVGLYSPWFVLNAAFYSSPDQILTLLYLHRTLNCEKYFAPFNLSIISEINGKG